MMDVFYNSFFEPTTRAVNSESSSPLPGAGPHGPRRATFEIILSA